jgi:hypothetical protein
MSSIDLTAALLATYDARGRNVLTVCLAAGPGVTKVGKPADCNVLAELQLLHG